MSEPAAAASRPEASVSFDINSVAVKLTELWTDNARVWFAPAKTQFAIRNVSSRITKFYYFVAALNIVDAAQVVDLIEDPRMSPSRRAVYFLWIIGSIKPTV